jgi:hypothetical protein
MQARLEGTTRFIRETQSLIKHGCDEDANLMEGASEAIEVEQLSPSTSQRG